MTYYQSGMQQYPSGGTPINSMTPIAVGPLGTNVPGYAVNQGPNAAFDPTGQSVGYSAAQNHSVTPTPIPHQHQQQYQQSAPSQYQGQHTPQSYPPSYQSNQLTPQQYPPAYQSQQATPQPFPSQQYQQQPSTSAYLQTQIHSQPPQQQQQQLYISPQPHASQSQSQPLTFAPAPGDGVRDSRNAGAIEVVTNPQTSILQLAEFASVMVYTLWHTRPNINGASSNAYNVVPHRMTVPASAGPAFRKFCLKVLSATQLSSSVILLALKYIQKLLKNNPSIHGQQGSEFRLFTVSLMLANKFLDDNTFTNKTWSDVTGINVKEINVMEMEFLNQVQFSLFVSEAEYLDWLHSLETWLKQQGQPGTG
ncbi:hypothetical protein BGZ76_004918 [Entomortierella beljakovae]|nr:hypothetical protein BGZ76_004918 [Entomortierella beljakovae]